jgi:predicted acyl esterase
MRRFPYAVREIEHAWIPLRDGCRLAARMWLPDRARACPRVSRIHPVRQARRDARARTRRCTRGSRARLAALRVDLRGSGESDGVLLDEYLPQEQEDGAS